MRRLCLVLAVALFPGCVSSSGGDDPQLDDAGPGQPDGAVQPDLGSMQSDGAVQGTDGGLNNGSSPTGPEVSASRVDGQYAEVLPSPAASVATLVACYSNVNFKSFIDGVLGLRYPIGQYIVAHAPTTSIDCLDSFVSDRSSASAVMRDLSTAVHECGHVLDTSLPSSTYQITTALAFTCSGASYTGANSTFARSLIRTDSFSAARPPCPTMGTHGCDGYADVYLNGDPTNGTFESGDQGFNMVLEEAVQYVNSLATAYAFEDQIPNASSVSERDGILTYLWYVERYLHLSRLGYPGQYSYLSNDACWRKAILTLWGRAWLYLDTTAGHDKLQIDGDLISELVHDPVLLDEIARLRTLEGCP